MSVKWAVIKRSMHPSMIGRQGRTHGGNSAGVWQEGDKWAWQIFNRLTGINIAGGLATSERKAKVLATRCLKEFAR